MYRDAKNLIALMALAVLGGQPAFADSSIDAGPDWGTAKDHVVPGPAFVSVSGDSDWTILSRQQDRTAELERKVKGMQHAINVLYGRLEQLEKRCGCQKVARPKCGT